MGEQGIGNLPSRIREAGKKRKGQGRRARWRAASRGGGGGRQGASARHTEPTGGLLLLLLLLLLSHAAAAGHAPASHAGARTGSATYTAAPTSHHDR